MILDFCREKRLQMREILSGLAQTKCLICTVDPVGARCVQEARHESQAIRSPQTAAVFQLHKPSVCLNNQPQSVLPEGIERLGKFESQNNCIIILRYRKGAERNSSRICINNYRQIP
jgi:hypothetical protein